MAVELRYRPVLAAALATLAWLLAPAAARAVPYGMGDPNLDAQCPAANSCPAKGWLDPLIHGGYGMSYVRTQIPYDAIASADANGRCIWSGSGAGAYSNLDPDEPGEQYRAYLYIWLMAAKRLGLAPVIGFTKGSARIDDAIPSDSQLDQGRYYCAVYWTLWVAARWGVPVHYVEPWNEPDVNGYSGNAVGAATDYDTAYEAATQVHADHPSVPQPEVAAGTLSSMGCAAGAVCSNLVDYLNAYIGALHHTPGYWSFHDYDDVTAAGARAASPYTYNLEAFNDVLANWYGPTYSAPIWITEAGARIDQPNIREPDGSEPECNNGELDGYNLAWGGGYKVGNCLDWVPDQRLARLRQAWAAQGFHDLATALGGRVTQVDWWTPDDAPGTGWDSALLDAAGTPRSSYCVLAYAETPATASSDPRCPGSPLDAGDIDGQ
jgi:hypothetical protein